MMKFSRFKFNKASTIEAIVIAVMILPTIFMWSKAIANMQYYLNFKRALAYYSADQKVQVDNYIRRAEKAREGVVYLNVFKANYLIEQDNFKDAREIYQYLQESMLETVALPQIGLAVCDLHEISAIKEQALSLRKLYTLTKKIEALTREEPRCSDAHIVLGHLYLKTSLVFKKKDKEKSEQYLHKAWQKFTEIAKRLNEVRRMDENGDGQISQAEWKGKVGGFAQFDLDGDDSITNYELCELYSPPGRGACFSFYLGQGLTAYYKAMDILQHLSPIEIADAKTAQVTEYLAIAIQSMRSAFELRIHSPFLLQTISHLYGQLLSLPWIPSKKRQNFLQQAEFYRHELDDFFSHLFWVGGRDRQSFWKIYNGINALDYGRGVSCFYLGNINQAKSYFHKVRSGTTHPHDVDDNYVQAVLRTAEFSYRQDLDSKHLVLRAGELGYYKKFLKKIKLTEQLSFENFVKINNYLLLSYFRGIHEKSHRQRCFDMLMKIRSKVPADKFKFFVGVQEDPVSARQIVLHNLYIVQRSLDKNAAQQYQKYELHRKK